jgi:hypothetical protein
MEMAKRVLRAVSGAMLLFVIALPSHAQVVSREAAAAAFLQRYLAIWSAPNGEALPLMDRIYPDQVSFYGEALSHPALMDVKRRFAARWPERSLRARPETIRVACEPGPLCVVDAAFDWSYSNEARHTHSSGSADLRLEVQDGAVILAESGSVIPAGVLPQQTLQGLRDPVHAKNLPALRAAYTAHAGNEDWVAHWLARERDFAVRATFLGMSQAPSGTGSSTVLHAYHFETRGGPIACLGPPGARLAPGQSLIVQGVVVTFVEQTLFLGDCTLA